MKSEEDRVPSMSSLFLCRIPSTSKWQHRMDTRKKGTSKFPVTQLRSHGAQPSCFSVE